MPLALASSAETSAPFREMVSALIAQREQRMTSTEVLRDFEGSMVARTSRVCRVVYEGMKSDEGLCDRRRIVIQMEEDEVVFSVSFQFV